MNFLLTWSKDLLEFQAFDLDKQVSLFLIAAVALVALAWILTRSR